MIRLYSRREAERFRLRAILSAAAAALALALGLTVCILLCCRVRTLNASRLEITVIGVSVLAGWIALPLFAWGYRPAWAEYRHMRGILEGRAETYTGFLTVDPLERTLPRSITVKKASLDQDGREIALTLNARLARRMPPRGSLVRVTAVRRYITAYEVLP